MILEILAVDITQIYSISILILMKALKIHVIPQMVRGNLKNTPLPSTTLRQITNNGSFPVETESG
jgi:hypothetical protein